MLQVESIQQLASRFQQNESKGLMILCCFAVKETTPVPWLS
jgi:hypothetical protein